MNRLEAFLFKQLALHTLARPCPHRIPRSGPEGKAVNCFTLSVEGREGNAVFVESIAGDAMHCFFLNENGGREERILQISAIKSSDVRVKHFKGHAEISFLGLWDYVFGRTFRWPYLRIWADEVWQWFFNRRSLASAQQTVVLAALLEQADAPVWDRGLSIFSLAERLASGRYWLHPDAGQFRVRVQLYLDAFESRGWVRKIEQGSVKYVITGDGVAELDRRDEEERKHTANLRLQWALWLLALVSAGSAVVQANIFKVPILLDFTLGPASSSIVRPAEPASASSRQCPVASVNESPRVPRRPVGLSQTVAA